MVVAAVVGGVATVGGAVASSSASKKASKTAANTAASNNALQSQIYNENEATLAPYVGTGNAAGTAINNLLGIGGDPAVSAKAYQNWQSSTGYQQALQTGSNQVQAALGSKGLLDSGAALKSLTAYGQNAANQNFQTYLGDLGNQQSTGLTAASAQAGVGQSYANAVSANNNTAAEASENADIAGANSINSALGSLTSSAALYGGLQSSYGGAALGGYSSSAATAPQYGYGAWNGFT